MTSAAPKTAIPIIPYSPKTTCYSWVISRQSTPDGRERSVRSNNLPKSAPTRPPHRLVRLYVYAQVPMQQPQQSSPVVRSVHMRSTCGPHTARIRPAHTATGRPQTGHQTVHTGPLWSREAHQIQQLTSKDATKGKNMPNTTAVRVFMRSMRYANVVDKWTTHTTTKRHQTALFWSREVHKIQ